MTINVPITLQPQDINDIICTAIEGGITYWCLSYMGYGDNLKLDGADQLKEEYGETVTRASDIKYAYEWLGFGGYLTLEEASVTHRLDLDLFKAGLEKWISSQTFKPGEAFDIGDIDAGDADSIVQYAIFGELKYG